MYKDLGKWGAINFRSIRYQEAIQAERASGYKLGFDFILLPCIMISNSQMRVMITIQWLTRELIWFRYKEAWLYTDIQGITRTEYKGIRYFLSLKWLFDRKKY